MSAPEAGEEIWWQVILPAYESTGGLAQTMYCLKCGAVVVVTQQDGRAAEIHVVWHGLLAMGMAR